LVVVGDARTLWAIAEVSESRLAEVALGAPARVLVPAFGDLVRTGEVAAVATALEAATRTAEVRVVVPNPDGALLPGMFLQVEIESSAGASGPVLAVPDAAVLTIEGRPAVFLPVAPGASVFCKHEVEVGAPVGDHFPILAGLQPGALVVVSGTFRLKAELGKGAAEHQH
jgi:multidrug efflux pump subunit AcrA (membrane-fusion protein)